MQVPTAFISLGAGFTNHGMAQTLTETMTQPVMKTMVHFHDDTRQRI